MSSTTERRILLVRPAYATGLTRTVRLVTEPLELEYLAAVAAAHGCSWRIHDPAVTGESLAEALAGFEPDIVAITGYYPTRDAMLAAAQAVKAWRPGARVVIGGVHAELNPADFQHPTVDAIIYAGGALTFGQWLDTPAGQPCPGVWTRSDNPPPGESAWIRHSPPAPANADPRRLPHPDRSHFNGHREAFTHLHLGPVALVKTAFGCPHDCNFCYCRLLNDGRYTPRPLDDVADEIAAVKNDRIWLVDDTFLASPSRAVELASLLEQRNIRRRFIIYARATDISRNPGGVASLTRLGVTDVLVGMEAVQEEQLAGYRKGATVDDNRLCVERLHAAGIECTGLFIVEPDANWQTFNRLDRWIDSTPLRTITLSIATPFPGTPHWERDRARLTTLDCRRWDLCHLVLPSPNLPRWLFYVRFAWSHLRILRRNPALRRHVWLNLVRPTSNQRRPRS